MRKKLMFVFVAVALGLGFLTLGSPAQAHLLDITYGGTGNDNLSDLKELVTVDPDAQLVRYEWSSESNSYVYEGLPYFTVFTDATLTTPLPAGAQVDQAYVVWDLEAAEGELLYLVMKAGTQWWYYPVSEDQWIAGGGWVQTPEGVTNEISHWTGYGTVATYTDLVVPIQPIPEPIGMLLMGAGLMTWGVVHRRRRTKKTAH